MDHQGRHALVTGGGTGIGLSIAQALAEAGAQVTITGRRPEVLEAAATDRIHPLAFDIADAPTARAAIAQAAEARGPIAITVANAGIAEGAAFGTISDEDWRRTMSINLDGAFTTIQAAMATLSHGAWGRVIAVSSIAGLKGLKYAVPYTASKHGMIGLIRGLAEEHLGGELTFNAICPGYVETEIVRAQSKKTAQRRGVDVEEAMSGFARANRHGRLLQTDEIAATALWLCSDSARSINGQAIEIFGGSV